MVDLHKLEQFVALARTGSFARASAALHLTQPALTRIIQSLEQHFGTKLVERERGRSGARLTDAGELLLRRATDLLDRASDLERSIAANREVERATAAFGIGPMLAGSLLTGILTEMLRDHPTLEATVLVGDSDTMARRLLSGDIEFYIGLEPPSVMSSQLTSKVFGTALGAFFVRSGHPLAGRSEVSADDIARYPIVSGTAWRELPFMASDDAERRLFDSAIALDNYPLLEEIASETDSVLVSSMEPVRASFVRLPFALARGSSGTDILVNTVKGITPSPLADEFVHRLRLAFRSGYEAPA